MSATGHGQPMASLLRRHSTVDGKHAGVQEGLLSSLQHTESDCLSAKFCRVFMLSWKAQVTHIIADPGLHLCGREGRGLGAGGSCAACLALEYVPRE